MKWCDTVFYALTSEGELISVISVWRKKYSYNIIAAVSYKRGLHVPTRLYPGIQYTIASLSLGLIPLTVLMRIQLRSVS